MTKANIKFKKKCNLSDKKNILLNILNYFDKLCNENGLNYTLDSGTLLGAARHKGFIPWDDDIDVAMPYGDYYKLISIADRLNNNGRYIFHGYSKELDDKENYGYPFLKLEDSNTEAVFYHTRDQGGAWIDIFPLTDVPDDMKVFKKYVRKLNRLHILLSGSNTKWDKNICKNIIRLLTLGKTNKYRNEMINIVRELGEVHSNRISDTVWADHRLKDIFPKEIISEYTYLTFEGKKFKVIKNYEKYLEIEYGDWRAMPPIKERVPHHNYDLFLK